MPMIADAIPKALAPIPLRLGHAHGLWRFHPPLVSRVANGRTMREGLVLSSWRWERRDALEVPPEALGPGIIVSDTFLHGGPEHLVALTRRIFLSDDGLRLAVQGRFDNRSGGALQVGDWSLFHVTGDADLRLDGTGAAQWRLFRNGRHKNDHPVVMSLGKADCNALAASAGSGECGQPGNTIIDHLFENDPVCILKGHDGRGPGTLLLGFLSEIDHLGSIDVVMVDDRSGLAELDAKAEMDGACIPLGVCRETSWLVLDGREDHLCGLDAYVASVARHHDYSGNKPPVSIYCSWYFYLSHFSPTLLGEELQAMADLHWPPCVLQIDDGWARCYGDWEPNERWADPGMAVVAQRIAAAGRTPGIWIAPFAVHRNSRLAQEHPQWLLKDSAGRSADFWDFVEVLDPTHPQAQGWLHERFSRLRADGYAHFKCDFSALVALKKDLLFHDPEATRAQAYRKGFTVIRQAIGAEGFLLICGGLYLPSLGLADSQRTGADVFSRWTDPPAKDRLRQNLLRFWMGRLWLADPDSMMVRRRQGTFDGIQMSLGLLTDEEARTIAVNQYLGGGILDFSERLSELEGDRAALYRCCLPPLAVCPRPADLFTGQGTPAIYVTRLEADGLGAWHTVAFVNLAEEPRLFAPRLTHDLLPEAVAPESFRWCVWEFFERRFLGLGRWGDPLPSIVVPAHGTRVLRLTPYSGRVATLVGTDRHLSMGAAEIISWTVTPEAISFSTNASWGDPWNLFVAVQDARGPDAEPVIQVIPVLGMERQHISLPGLPAADTTAAAIGNNPGSAAGNGL